MTCERPDAVRAQTSGGRFAILASARRQLVTGGSVSGMHRAALGRMRPCRCMSCVSCACFLSSRLREMSLPSTEFSLVAQKEGQSERKQVNFGTVA